MALEVLAREVQSPLTPQVIWDAWPPAPQNTLGGDALYWRSLVQRLVELAVASQKDIWPLSDNSGFTTFDRAFIATPEYQDFFLALSRAGVSISVPPSYIVHAMSVTPSDRQWRKMTPHTVRDVLRVTRSPHVFYAETHSIHL